MGPLGGAAHASSIVPIFLWERGGTGLQGAAAGMYLGPHALFVETAARAASHVGVELVHGTKASARLGARCKRLLESCFRPEAGVRTGAR